MSRNNSKTEKKKDTSSKPTRLGLGQIDKLRFFTPPYSEAFKLWLKLMPDGRVVLYEQRKDGEMVPSMLPQNHAEAARLGRKLVEENIRAKTPFGSDSSENKEAQEAIEVSKKFTGLGDTSQIINATKEYRSYDKILKDSKESLEIIRGLIPSVELEIRAKNLLLVLFPEFVKILEKYHSEPKRYVGDTKITFRDFCESMDLDGLLINRVLTKKPEDWSPHGIYSAIFPKKADKWVKMTPTLNSIAPDEWDPFYPRGINRKRERFILFDKYSWARLLAVPGSAIPESWFLNMATDPIKAKSLAYAMSLLLYPRVGIKTEFSRKNALGNLVKDINVRPYDIRDIENSFSLRDEVFATNVEQKDGDEEAPPPPEEITIHGNKDVKTCLDTWESAIDLQELSDMEEIGNFFGRQYNNEAIENLKRVQDVSSGANSAIAKKAKKSAKELKPKRYLLSKEIKRHIRDNVETKQDIVASYVGRFSPDYQLLALQVILASGQDLFKLRSVNAATGDWADAEDGNATSDEEA